jgi:hypothetical protein
MGEDGERNAGSGCGNEESKLEKIRKYVKLMEPQRNWNCFVPKWRDS